MKIKEIITSLKELGFTEYEAKVYLALLQSHPSNGNEIATLSGVPGPKVYETLRKMLESEIIFIVTIGNKKNQIHYSPLPYEELLNTKKESFIGNISYLSKALSEVSSMSVTDSTTLFVIHGYSSSMESVRSAITECKTEIILSCWCRELDVLEGPLIDAYNRGVKIVTLIFEEMDRDLPWRNFKHYKGKIVDYRHAGELSIVLDQSKAIILQSLNKSPHAVVSSHQATITTIRNYIRHDIYVNRILHDFKGVVEQRYGPDLEHLINDF